MQNNSNAQNIALFPYLSKVCALLLTVFLVGCSDQAAENAQTYDSYVQSANDYASQGQYRAALIEGSNAIQLLPERLEAYRAMAEIYLKLGQSREAAGMLSKVANPDEAILLLLLEANLDTGKLRSASEVIDQLANPDAVAALKLRARLAATRGNAEESEALYQQALAASAGDAEALMGLARVKLTQGQVDAALENLVQAAADPELQSQSLFVQAAIASQRQELEQAETLLNEAISALPATDIITPIRYSILSALKDNLTSQGKSEEAMIYDGLLQEALPEAGETAELLEQAFALIQEGDLEAARSSINEAVEIAPQSPRAATLLAAVDYLEGDSESAVALLDQIIDPETSSATELQIYAVSQLRLNNPAAVVERLQKDVDDMTDGKLVALYAVALQSSGDAAGAEKYFAKSIELDPSNGRLHIPVAQLLVQRGEQEAALAEMRQAFEKSPDDEAVQRLMIGQLIRTGATDEADTLVKGLAASYPESLTTQLIVGTYYFRAQQFEQAETALTKSLELGEAPLAREQLASLFMSREDYSGAEAQYRKLVEVAPSRDAFMGLVTVLELTDRRTKVVDELEGVLSDNFSNAGILVLSEYLGRNGRLAEAVAAFDRYEGELSADATRLSESLTLAKARELITANNISGARDLLNKSLENAPQSERLLVSLIGLNTRDGQFSSAQNQIDQLAEFVDTPLVGILRGDLAAAQSNYALALTEYVAVFDTTPDDQVGFKVLGAMQRGESAGSEVSAFLDRWVGELDSVASRMARAGFYLEQQDNPRAREDYLQVLQADPNNVAAHNNLAWTYDESQSAEALAASEKAYQLAGNNPQILDTYGWFLHLNGQTAKALPILEKALELAPDDAEIQGHYDQAVQSAEG